jgi:hypothetical protein
MTLCEEVGRWIDDTIIKPVEQLFTDLRQACIDYSTWIQTEVITPLETWISREEQRCREQECNWWCLCCNKWFCWLVVVLVSVITWVITVVGKWVVETICRLIVEILRIIVMTTLHVLKWIVETVVCIIDKLCQTLILLAGLALIAAVLGVVSAASLLPVPLALPAVAVGIGAAVAALLLAKVLCELGMCRLVGVIVWALKWGIVAGALLAIAALSGGSALVVVLCGGLASALTWWLLGRGCPVPRLLGLP